MAWRCIGVFLAAPLLSSCTGSIGSPSGPGIELQGSAHEVRFVCKPEAPAGDAMHRLSRTQYENTVHDLLQAELPSYGKDTWDEVSLALASMPDDTIAKSAPFATMDQAVSQQHVDSYLAVAQAAAQALTSDDARVAALLSCRAGEADDDCVSRFIRSFGRRAFRHSLLESEFSYLSSVYAAKGIDVAALRDVIVVALDAPQFLYRVELGAEPLAQRQNTFALSDVEQVTRLAYHFWQTMPDDALLDLAEQSGIQDDAGYEQLVETVAHDARAERSLRVFVREWLHLDELRPLDSLLGDPTFDAFVGADKPSPELRDAMIEDVLDSFTFHLQRDDSFADWFTSPYSFAASDELAALYGSPKWHGHDSEPPRFPAGERSGLLTRAALLSTGTAKTRPIMKGVFVRDRILCDSVPPPPANATTIPAELTSKMSTREVVERLTQQPKSSCASCHDTLINPLGFATENYDALGRIRSKEVLYSPEGKELGATAVETHSVPRIWQNDSQSSKGAGDLTALILDSGKAEACFARQYVRFAYGRREDDEVDGCALEAVRSALQDGQSLQLAVRAPALAPEFRQRFLGDVQ